MVSGTAFWTRNLACRRLLAHQRWLRRSFGVSVIRDMFQKRVNQVLEGLEGIPKIADDILIYGVGDTGKQANADHDKKLQALLLTCREHGIALKKVSSSYEKKCLSIVYALQRFHQYTFGRNVLVHSDHKPIESILKEPLESAPRRIQGIYK